MKRTINIVPLQRRYDVEVKDANRDRRNRSFSNASDCCGVKLKQDKLCSGCGKRIDVTPSRKIIKLGKEEHLIEAAILESVQETLEAKEEITIEGILSELQTEALQNLEDYYDALMYALPTEKKHKDYAELAKLLEGNVAVGRAVVRSNEFQVLITVGMDSIIRIRKLIEDAQRYPVDASDAQQIVAANAPAQPFIDVARKVLQKKQLTDFNVSTFKDTRSAMEEEVIEAVILRGEMPQAAKSNVVQQQEADELARLQAMLNE